MGKLLSILLFALFALFQYQLWFAPDGLRKAQHVHKMIKQKEFKLAQISQENAKLAYEISNLKHKEEEIEHNARSSLGMIKSDETFYQIVDEYEYFSQ